MEKRKAVKVIALLIAINILTVSLWYLENEQDPIVEVYHYEKIGELDDGTKVYAQVISVDLPEYSKWFKYVEKDARFFIDE